MQQWCKKYSWTIFIRSKKLEKLKYGHKYRPIEFQMAFLYIDSCVFTNYGPFSFQAKHGRICSKWALLKAFVCLFCKWSYWVKFPLTQRCRKRRRCKQVLKALCSCSFVLCCTKNPRTGSWATLTSACFGPAEEQVPEQQNNDNRSKSINFVWIKMQV